MPSNAPSCECVCLAILPLRCWYRQGCYGTREPPFEFERFSLPDGSEDWRCRDGVLTTSNVSWYLDDLPELRWLRPLNASQGFYHA